ncbi:MAG TPA: hypothetical protein VN758_00685 [Solirubrobacterales bacterium]|nr:hypothetical protein [Solirubrobacterales bacterium]
MALRQAFKDDLNASYRTLGEEQKRLEGLRDLAEHDGLPTAVVSILARKANSVGYMREDLLEIPKRVAEAEARR